MSKLSDKDFSEMFQQIIRIRSEEEIEELKRNWTADPCWDIDETPGFEAHKEELKAFQDAMEAKWQARRDAETWKVAKKHDCSFKTAQYIERLEWRLKRIEAELLGYNLDV